MIRPALYVVLPLVVATIIFPRQILLAAEQSLSETAPSYSVGEYTIGTSINQLLGESSARRYLPIMPVDENINWVLYVPADYDPTQPPGLLVYISPSNSGRIPKDWKSLMDQHNLIWIGADKSGNKINTRRRVTYALLATGVASREYCVDPKRIYLSGLSGGSRVASMVATLYPEMFRGAIYNIGVNVWAKGITPEAMDLIRANRYVFISGTNDFNLRGTKRVFRKYQKAGVDHSRLVVVPRMGHEMPPVSDIERAIGFLDAVDNSR